MVLAMEPKKLKKGPIQYQTLKEMLLVPQRCGTNTECAIHRLLSSFSGHIYLQQKIIALQQQMAKSNTVIFQCVYLIPMFVVGEADPGQCLTNQFW
jgi:hypothetical protein